VTLFPRKDLRRTVCGIRLCIRVRCGIGLRDRTPLVGRIEGRWDSVRDCETTFLWCSLPGITGPCCLGGGLGSSKSECLKSLLVRPRLAVSPHYSKLVRPVVALDVAVAGAPCDVDRTCDVVVEKFCLWCGVVWHMSSSEGAEQKDASLRASRRDPYIIRKCKDDTNAKANAFSQAQVDNKMSRSG